MPLRLKHYIYRASHVGLCAACCSTRLSKCPIPLSGYVKACTCIFNFHLLVWSGLTGQRLRCVDGPLPRSHQLSELAEFPADLERIAGVLLVEGHQQPAQQQQRQGGPSPTGVSRPMPHARQPRWPWPTGPPSSPVSREPCHGGGPGGRRPG